MNSNWSNYLNYDIIITGDHSLHSWSLVVNFVNMIIPGNYHTDMIVVVVEYNYLLSEF